MGSVIETNVVCQIGLVVNDVEKTGQAFADFFGIERPEIADSGPDEIEGKIKTLGEKGFPLMQKGNYGNGSGMYAYIDARKDLKLIFELLESF